MKRLLLVLCALLAPALSFGAAYDVGIDQRPAANNVWERRLLISPTTTGIMTYNPSTLLPVWVTLGQGLQVSGGVLSSTASTPTWASLTGKPEFSAVATTGSYSDLAGRPVIPPAQLNSDWSASSGVAQILNKPILFSGAYSDLSGKPALFSGSYNDLADKPLIPPAQVPSDWSATTGAARILNKPALFSGAYTDLTSKPSLFDGAYSSLSGVPASFAPAAHNQSWSTITGTPTSLSGYGITDGLTSSALSGYATSVSLASGLAGKLNNPSGTVAQYLRGDGTLATFPSIPAAQVQADWNASSAPSAILNKPVLFSGSYSALTGIPSTFAPSAHTQAWSTITATPTTVAGYGLTDAATTTQLAAKLNTPTGTTSQYVRGDGSLAALPAAKRIETYTGTTNASGQIVVTYPTAFAQTPNVQPPAPALANQVWTTISSTATGFTLQLNQRNTIVLLSTEVLLGATVPVAGTAAQIVVIER